MCECIDKVKAYYAKRGGDVKIIGASFYIGKDKNFHDFMTGKCRYTLENGKHKTETMVFAYCPFCGKKYEFEQGD